MFVFSVSLSLSFFVSLCFHVVVVGCDLQVWNLTRLNKHNHLLVSKTNSQQTKTLERDIHTKTDKDTLI
jgi:hypothetical protein